MFNSGFRGKREQDGRGVVNPQSQYVQTIYPQPAITGWSIAGSDDTALNPAGGQTVLVNGSGFATGASATLGGSQISVVTVVSPTQISFTAPANSGGSYTLIVYNSSGGAAILVPGLTYSSVPTWTTPAGSIGTYYETTAINSNVVATSDSAMTYSLASGSLPSGATLYANGVITGSAPADSGSTTYTFDITATDAELQDVTRTFTMTINVDVVTWVSPTNGTTYTTPANAAISNVSLSATDAAGYGIVYTANALPTGVSLSGSVISGTPTVGGNTSTLLTATANTTSRTATNTIYWVVQLGDSYWNLTTLALNSLPVTTPFQSDASLNNASISVVADTRASNRNPYQTGYYSNYFDGTGDYLTATITALGSSDWTIEAWVYPTRSATEEIPIGCGPGASGSWELFLSYPGYSSKVRFTIYGDTNVYASSTTYNANAWNHVAVVRSSGNITVYLNGVPGTTTAINPSYNNSTVTGLVIGRGYTDSTSGSFIGYVSNARIVKGTAVYTTNFTPSTTPLVNVSGTSVLTCQSYRLIDSSPNNLTITKNGDTTVLPFNPFATVNDYGTTYYSTYFDGSGDNLSAPYNTAFEMGSGDYTVECWIYPTSDADGGIVFKGQYQSGETWNPGFGIRRFSASNVRFTFNTTGANASEKNYDYTGGVAAYTWTHLAMVVSSGVGYAYVNGTLVNAGGLASIGTLATGSYGVTIGAFPFNAGNIYFAGIVSNVRITKGQALYTTNFTPSTTPLTTTSQGATASNVSLLTCQNATLIDNSTNAFAITSSGQAQPKPVSPFTTTNYSSVSTTIPTLGSGYFDGTGDYLNAGSSGAYSLGTSAYTVEFWVYHTSLATVQVYYTTQTTGGLQVWYDTTSGLSVGKYGSSPVITSGLNYVVVNQWNYIAISRVSTSSNSTRIFVNGVAVATGTDSNDYGTISGPLYIGSQSSGNGVTGYISNIRMVKGTALYTANFYPSTTPLTAVTNTSLLTLQYNGGSNDSQFIDTSNVQNLITRAGNATQGTVSPFSATGWSGHFDGTGDYLSFASLANAQTAFPGTGAFTIEAWVYPSTTTWMLVTAINTGASAFWWEIYHTASAFNLLFGYWGSSSSTAGTSALVPINAWTHVVVQRRTDNTIDIYYNGVAQTVTNNFYGGYIGANITPTAIPKIASGGYNTAGAMYISNFRFTPARVYTSNFTPSTTPLTAISGTSGTSFLTLQNPRFIDNSPNRLPITTAGDAKTQSFSPFGPVTVTPYYSNYFDGSGDYLSLPSNSINFLHQCTASWTFECWFYTSSSSAQTLLSSDADSASIGINISLSNGATNNIDVQIFRGSTGNFYRFYTGTAYSLSTWNHVAVTYNGSTFTVYVNGISQALTTSGTATFSTSNATYQPAIGTYQSGGGNGSYMNGYISNLRITNGLAVYTGAFTPPTAPLAATQSSGTNIAAITQTSYSNYFDGTGDYLSLASTSTLALGTGDFTIEFWVYANTVSPTYQVLYDQRTANSGIYPTIYLSSASLRYLVNAADRITGSNISAGVWNHVAVVRLSGSTKMFLNGVQTGSTYTDSNDYLAQPLKIGADYTPANYLNGYISNLRVTKGQALYTTTFTPSTTPLTTTSQGATAANVSLLTCQSTIFSDNSTNSPNSITVNGNTVISGSNPFSGSTMLLTSQSSTFVDNSVNAFALTVNGNTIPSTTAPFAATTTTGVSYTTAINGGSMYFDGNGDYLQIPSNPALAIGQSTATVEFWVYPLAVDGYRRLVTSTASGFTSADFVIRFNSGTFLAGAATNSINSSTLPSINQWNHVAWVGVGGSTQTLYINGVSVGTQTTYNITTPIQYVGGYYSTGPAEFSYGYMSGVRITKGTAVYTSAFSLPTAPPTPTAAVPLLLNGTAGSIIDYTGKNDLETVADARLAPQNPYGGSYYSNYFDGNGDYLTIANDASADTAFNFGTGNFTIECWAYFNSFGGANYAPIFGNSYLAYVGSNGQVLYFNGSTNVVTGTSGDVSLNTWTHLAWVRNGTTVTIYVNGVSKASGTVSASIGQGSVYAAAIGINSTVYFSGHISNLRVVKGQAIYTSAFTPSTSPLTTTSQSATAANVSLLTCQSSTFKDNSTNAFTVTRFGDTAVNSVNPFQNNGTYSMYFDGTGDYEKFPLSSNFQFGTGDFTIEFWLYLNSVASNQVIYDNRNGANGAYPTIYMNTSSIRYYTNSADQITGATLTTGQWYYIAVCKASGSTKLFVNGTQSGSTFADSMNYLVAPLNIGADYTPSSYLNGYVTDLRVTKYARYTTAFTPPTSTFQTK